MLFSWLLVDEIRGENMSIFSMFKKRRKEDSEIIAKKVVDVVARAEGKLSPPNLMVTFKCECGRWLSHNLNNFNPIGGTQVMCAHCGAVILLPPEILDHTPTDSKTASLKPDWQQIVRIVRHGREQ